MKYNRLTFICDVDMYVKASGKRERQSKWMCDCGVVKDIPHYAVKSGNSKSCGCIATEKSSNRFTKMNTTHGMRRHELHSIWAGMIARCRNKNHKHYARYGGRGISVCSEWLASFKQFVIDMGARPTRKHQIERKNNNQGYSKDNCIWAKCVENNRNKSNSRRWVVNKICFLTAKEGGLFNDVCSSTIQRWCKNINKKDCYSFLVYQE